ncbi:MAG: heterodisulfide reductase-related iron-sulfur binding cluster [Actinomycetota bacterium]|nr:heterodisulfide reductase-related iron-sulfur binding cluster [Actinomycetota bacterium]
MAFDAHRPPGRELIDVCVHCGFCLPTCPTYTLWGEEMDSPRGRIALMKVGLEEGSELSPAMVTHFDRCLGCMACVTACPSGVQYDRLIEATRPQVERNYERSARERLLRRFLFATFTHPARLRALVPLLAASRPLGVRALARRLDDSSQLGALMRLVPDVRLAVMGRRMRTRVRARGTPRGRVGLLQGCVQRVFFHDVNVATAAVLAAEGFEVYAPERPRCCGALMFHSGYEPEALALARELIVAFEDCDYIVVNAAGCGSSMKDYGHVLQDDPDWRDRARSFSARVRDVSQLLAEFEPVVPRQEVPLRVAYHDACHLAHAQGVRAEPRALLSALPGLELVEPAEWEICCGSAGIYNLAQPEAGAELGRRKAKNLLATGADAIAAGNPGCVLQIATYLEEAGRPLPIYHPMELVRMSIEGGGRNGDSSRGS